MTATQEMYIPTSVKKKLLDIAKKLPEDRRTQFIVNTSKEIASFAGEFAKEHKYTIIYGSIGYLVGHLLDEVLVITIPMVGQWRPTQNVADLLLGITGMGFGFMKDHDVYRLQTILKREIQKALA